MAKKEHNTTYQVTARKWRPKNFNELKGQEHIAQTLTHIIDSGKIAHAYLFSGPRGVGKTTTARILAKCLNCETGPTMTPCDECINCEEISKGISPDVIEIDGASNRGVDRIRELRESVKYLPSKSKYKIYIIDEVHMLTTEAFNALLKTLEEPPEHVIFIFATTEPHKVKITIRSRCQHFLFKRMNLETLKEQIQLILDSYNITYDEASVEAIARSADGSMRDSQSIMDQVIAYSGEKLRIEETRKVLGVSGDEKFYEFIKHLIKKDITALLSLTGDIVNTGVDLSTFSVGLMETFRDLCIIKSLPDESPAILDISNEQIKELKNFTQYFDLYQLREISRRIIKLNTDIRNTVNQRFLFESFIFNIIDYENFVSFGKILRRIENIEKELANIDDSEITVSEDYIREVMSKNVELAAHLNIDPDTPKQNISTQKKTTHDETTHDETTTSKITNNIEKQTQNETKSNQANTETEKASPEMITRSKNETITTKEPEQKPQNKSTKKIKPTKQHIALLAEDLRNNENPLTASLLINAENLKYDDDKQLLTLFFNEEFAFDRCKRDNKQIAESCKKIFGIPLHVEIEFLDKKNNGYTNIEFEENKKNIEKVFDGKELL